MASVDAELSWGDERLGAASHPLGVSFDPGGPFGALSPLAIDGADVVLVVPPRARAWIHTANGWRDLVTLRVLGCVAPDATPGAARVRMRRLRDVNGRVEGVAIVRRPEALLELEGFWLRVELSDDAAPATRVDAPALRSALAFAAFTLTLFAGILSALGAVPPRSAALDLTRLTPIELPRLPPVRVTAPAHVSERVETKHRVEPAPAGGRVFDDVLAPTQPRPSRRAAGSSVPEGRGERRTEDGLARMTAAVTALQTLGGPSPYTPGERTERRVPLARESWLALATLRGATGTLADAVEVRSASRPGPLTVGWGSGHGRTRFVLPPPLRLAVLPLSQVDVIPICERRFACGDGWSCHACGGVSDREAIRRVVRRHLPEMRFCYEQGSLHVPGVERRERVTLEWTIDPDGRVTDARVVEDGLGNPLVVGCLRAAPEGWRFPPIGPVRVRYPFVFHAR